MGDDDIAQIIGDVFVGNWFIGASSFFYRTILNYCSILKGEINYDDLICETVY